MSHRAGCAWGRCGFRSFAAVLLVAVAAAEIRAEAVLPSPSWKNSVSFPDDPFRASSPDGVGWIKFTLLLDDPTTIYFQDSNAYPFHYDWATEFVVAYQGMTPSEFDQITLFEDGQQAVLGSILLPPYSPSAPPAEMIPEYGIQLVRQDPYDPADVVSLFYAVKAAVSADPGVQVFYFPSFEQAASAEEHADYLASEGVIVSSTARWATGNVCYAHGWALGTLKYFPGWMIQTAYNSGSLGPGDILLTDGVPADLPPLAGLITLAPSTPSSHVAILAEGYGIPFTYLALAEDAARADELVGNAIVLRAFGAAGGGCDVRMIDLEGVLTPQQMEEILELKAPQPVNIPPMAAYGAYSAPTDGLVLSDIQYFGGKAAHFSLLRTAIPDHSRVSGAFSFDLWNAFMDQQLPVEETLRENIEARLSGYTWPPDMGALATDLHAIRQMIRSETSTSFAPALEDAIIDMLTDPQYDFDPYQRIRFRSSSNAEDGESFTAAGLYESFSGCLADDLEPGSGGPSFCNPDQPERRGVFRAIRRVLASFYNDNAFLERLRHGIDESEVGMAVLVHHSFPDEIELANGVAVLDKGAGTTRTIRLVTQKGAVSVTNPTDGSEPEVVDVSVFTFSTLLTLRQYSNLVPIGATVLEWEQEYRDLIDLLVAVADEYAQVTGKSIYRLNFEYKKIAPDDVLMVNQVRPLPLPDTTPSITPFLVNEPRTYCVFQGEFGNVFANHRLKSRWQMATRNLWLSEENLEVSLYDDLDMLLAGEGQVESWEGAPPTWPGASYDYAPYAARDGWVAPGRDNPTTYTLTTANVGQLVAPSQSPVLTIADLGLHGGLGRFLELQADYAKPEPAWEWPGPTTTFNDAVRLAPCMPERSGDLFQERVVEDGRDAVVTTRFYWPPPPDGPSAGYTAPLARWDHTVIEGLTSAPVVLTSDFAQTYRPEHHNFSEHFLFEPGLDPDVPAHLLDELRDRNIRLIHVFHDNFGTSTMTTYGFHVPGDFNRDGVVDGEDLAHFEACFSGAAVPHPGIGCDDADFDGDGDVDMTDFAILQRCLSGDQPADPNCAG